MRRKLESDITLIEFLIQFGKIIDTFEGAIYSVEHKFHLIGDHLEMMELEDVEEWKDMIKRLLNKKSSYFTDKKFVKRQWYTHTEPGQEKFLIRVEDPEKQICSGWDCKGNPFKNEWVHLGNRLEKADWVGVSKTSIGHLCMTGDTKDVFNCLNLILEGKIK